MGGYNALTGKYEYSNQDEMTQHTQATGPHAWMQHNKRPVTNVGFQTQATSGLGGSATPQMASDFAMGQAKAHNGGFSLGPGGRKYDDQNPVNIMAPPPPAPIDTGVRPGEVPAMNAVEQARMAQNPQSSSAGWRMDTDTSRQDSGVGGSMPPWANPNARNGAALAGYR